MRVPASGVPVVGNSVPWHHRLSSLSADLSASDPASSVFKQLTFPTVAGEGHPSPVFVPNRFKKDLSTDGVRIGQHYRYAVKVTFTLT